MLTFFHDTILFFIKNHDNNNEYVENTTLCIFYTFYGSSKQNSIQLINNHYIMIDDSMIEVIKCN